MASVTCCFSLGKVYRWYDWGELQFWVWLYLCGGTASLKFRQFKSAVCDAYGVFCLKLSLYGV